MVYYSALHWAKKAEKAVGECREIKNSIVNIYSFKGSVESYTSLPTNASIGDVYDVIDTGKNYAWTGSFWDDLGGYVDINKAIDDKIKAVSSLPSEIEPGVWYGTTSEVSEDSTGIDYVVETYRDEEKWCRVYRSGWIEQGGSIEVAKNSKGTIDLLKPYSNTNYTLTSNFYASTEPCTYNNTMKLSKSSKNQLSYDNSSLSHIMIIDWETKGQGA